jgi:hypothetical protein
MIAHATGDADPAGLGERFQAGGYVDAVTEDVAVLHHDVADIDADAEKHAPLKGHRVVGFGKGMLNLDRGVYGIEDAGEFGKHAVPGGAGDPPAMAPDRFVDDTAVCRKRRECLLLVGFH